MDIARYKTEPIERPTPGELAQMILDGASLDDLAADFGCSVRTVQRDLYDAGYSPVTGDEKTSRRPDDVRPPSLELPGPWADEALCAQVDGDEWFPERGESPRAAKAVCHRCPVERTCLEHALTNGERFGVWGGTTELERRRLERPVVAVSTHPRPRLKDADTGAHHHVNTAPRVPALAALTPTQQEATMTDEEITGLITDGKQHPTKRIQNAADRAEQAIEKLRELITADRESAEARAEVERLQAELREAKARAKGTTPAPPATPSRVDSRSIRAWAHDNNVACPDRGRVPQRVVDAYEAAS